ncbi:hypothetical protein H6F87_28860 [Cyanobacteria bacterium FACHB-502]|nr:hypothetical protein [Cyanobacteria bacterium FACHB-502]
MPRLFTYTIPIDDGAAPNPFYGMCSLAICKPGIRRTAQVGDWVAGLGSKKAPSGDLSGRLVYAMQVEEVLSLQDYDYFAPTRWTHRIPNVESLALHERLGDCIYNFSNGRPTQRRSVHGPGNMDTDLRGKNVLISRNFYYFGNRAIRLAEHLRPICHQTQGHRSNSNASYFLPFVDWLNSLALVPGQLYGWPDTVVDWSATVSCGGCTSRKDDDEYDPDC